MTEKDPADDPAASVQRYDHFRRESIEGAPHEGALPGIDVRQVRAGNQVRVQLKPADESVALPVLDVVGFRKATQAGAETVAIALPDLGKNSNASYAGRIGHTFDEVCQEGFDVIETPEHAGKTQERHGRLTPLGWSVKAPDRFWGVGDYRVFAEIAILLQDAQMVKTARDQTLQAPPIDLQILGRVNSRVFHLAQRL